MFESPAASLAAFRADLNKLCSNRAVKSRTRGLSETDVLACWCISNFFTRLVCLLFNAPLESMTFPVGFFDIKHLEQLKYRVFTLKTNVPRSDRYFLTIDFVCFSWLSKRKCHLKIWVNCNSFYYRSILESKAIDCRMASSEDNPQLDPLFISPQ